MHALVVPPRGFLSRWGGGEAPGCLGAENKRSVRKNLCGLFSLSPFSFPSPTLSPNSFNTVGIGH